LRDISYCACINGIVAKKSFGQNFLINDNVLESIVEAGNITEQDVVIEIGPGLGNLTEYLLNTGAKVICFEIDEKMQEILENRFKNKENLQIIMQDILKVDLKEYLPEDKKVEYLKNCMNDFLDMFNRQVWFMISENGYNKYTICMYYDNLYNQANGEDL
jgi:16S rRNA A1518/A1519 N6-dimethyltransferase RsmA/KsgA/DIM1 with predicted DNA glycosylase/AP lyase activity